MTELDLLNLARSITEHEVSWFAQMITINFAMIVAIYYFLHAARLPLKAFAFFAYTRPKERIAGLPQQSLRDDAAAI